MRRCTRRTAERFTQTKYERKKEKQLRGESDAVPEAEEERGLLVVERAEDDGWMEESV